MIYINVPLTRYNFPIVYGPKTVFYDLPNGTDRKLVVSNHISLCVLDMTGKVLSLLAIIFQLLSFLPVNKLLNLN